MLTVAESGNKISRLNRRGKFPRNHLPEKDDRSEQPRLASISNNWSLTRVPAIYEQFSRLQVIELAPGQFSPD